MVGKQILHYKVLEELGRGGMGVVYKAEDTKLERTVALKFLSLTSIGGEEKKRFKREAKAAASLNHPNIATVFAIDEADDQTFIAMEYIEGKSLHEIVGANGGSPMKIDDAIDYATQIAAGLQAAHEKGVIHRDIKSANIMVTDKGVVKIMDFGLAKLAHRSKMTMEGSTLGTAAYMSPEQARGEALDKRSDIWSLGVVLYEMLSGRMPFKGDYEQAVIYSIQNEEPEPLTALRSGVPIALDGIIAKALAKDQKTRYQHVDELPADLKALALESTGASRISTRHTRKKKNALRWPVVPWSRMAVMMIFPACLAGLATWFVMQKGPQPPAPITRMAIKFPLSFDTSDLIISPKGRQLIYQKSGDLYLHRMEELGIELLVSSARARKPFFSPDGRWIGFHANGKLKKMLTEGGGQPLDIVEVDDLPTGTWTDDDQIIFGGKGLFMIQASGGRVRRLTNLDTSRADVRHHDPQILPGGASVLFNIENTAGPDSARVAVLHIKNGEIRTLVRGGTAARYAPSGHLVYVQGPNEHFVAAPFDPNNLRITGAAVPIPELEGIPGHHTDISMNGTLAYLSRNAATFTGESALVWVDRKGKETHLTKQQKLIRAPRLSPDGTRVAFDTFDGFVGNVWIYDIERGRTDLFTFENPKNVYPIWTADGKWIVFASGKHGQPVTPQRKPADGSGMMEPLSAERFDHFPRSLSPGSRFLSFHTSIQKMDSWVLDLEKRSSSPFLSTPASEGSPMFSPDGKWIAYMSDETGQMEVYVQPFPATGAKYPVSVAGGGLPVWSRVRSELFYLQGKTLVSVSYDGSSPVFQIGRIQPLFTLPGGDKHWALSNYDYDDKNDRFLIAKNEASPGVDQIVVVLNWIEELKRLAPVGKD